MRQQPHSRVTDPGADAHRLIVRVLEEIGPRESCGEAERRLGALLAERWRALGLDVRGERFLCHPRAFLGSISLSVILYLAAVISFWTWPWLCVLWSIASLIVTVSELLRYRELVDPLFPEKEGENVVGVLAPRHEVRRRVVLSAHLDSAYEFNLSFLFRDWAVPIMVLGLGAPIVALAGGLLRALGGGGFEIMGWVCVGLLPAAILHLFFHTSRVVPGAMDNLGGIAVIDGVARAIVEDDELEGALEDTELVLLATSSEEAGLRGAKRFVAAHAEAFRGLATYGLFVDGICDERFLTVVDRELSSGARHDPRLVDLACDAARKRGWAIRRRMIPFGGTDAASFSLAGVPSVAILSMQTTRLARNYHTRYDTAENVRPRSLEVTLQLVLDLIRRFDAGELDGVESGKTGGRRSPPD